MAWRLGVPALVRNADTVGLTRYRLQRGSASGVRAGVAIVIAAVMALVATGVAAQQPARQPPPPPTRSIVKVTGDLYMATENTHNTVFLVTPQGIVLADPINAEFSTWLKGELATRFPNRLVRFVLHSHHDFDHASGAEVWNDTAEIVAHENFAAEVKKAAAVARPGQYADVRMPESTFHDRRTITLGGANVEMIDPGPNHALDTAVLYFPRERAVFFVDFITMKKRFSAVIAGPAPFPDWVKAMRAVEAINFDIAIPGHGDIGTKADVVTYREYFQDFIKVVSDGIAANQTVEQIQASPALDKYKDWQNFPQAKDKNIAEAYALLRAPRP